MTYPKVTETRRGNPYAPKVVRPVVKRDPWALAEFYGHRL
jgi:hypothetical protein